MPVGHTCIDIHTDSKSSRLGCFSVWPLKADSYRWCNNDLLLDPYAPLISGRRRFGVRDEIEEFEEKVHICDSATHSFGA